MRALATAATACGRLNFERNAVGVNDGSNDGGSTADAPSDTSTVANPCPTGQQLLLADDFDDGAISVGSMGTWASTFTSAVTVAESGGRLLVTFPVGSATNAHAGVISPVRDLSNVCVLVAVPVLPVASTPAYVYLTIEESTGANPGSMYLLAGGGVLEAWRQLSGSAGEMVAGGTHDPFAHAYWRLRTGAVVSWETSSDLVTWATIHEEPAYFDMTNAELVVGAGTDANSTNAGSAHFDTARIFGP